MVHHDPFLRAARRTNGRTGIRQAVWFSLVGSRGIQTLECWRIELCLRLFSFLNCT